MLCVSCYFLRALIYFFTGVYHFSKPLGTPLFCFLTLWSVWFLPTPNKKHPASHAVSRGYSADHVVREGYPAHPVEEEDDKQIMQAGEEALWIMYRECSADHAVRRGNMQFKKY